MHPHDSNDMISHNSPDDDCQSVSYGNNLSNLCAMSLILALLSLVLLAPYLTLPAGNHDLSLLLWTLENQGKPLAAWTASVPAELECSSPLVRFLGGCAVTWVEPWSHAVSWMNFGVFLLLVVTVCAFANRTLGSKAGFVTGFLFLSLAIPLYEFENCLSVDSALWVLSSALVGMVAINSWRDSNYRGYPWLLPAVLIYPPSSMSWLCFVAVGAGAFILFYKKGSTSRAAQTISIAVVLGYIVWPYFYPASAPLHIDNGRQFEPVLRILTAGTGAPIFAVLCCAAFMHSRHLEMRFWLVLPLVWLLFRWAEPWRLAACGVLIVFLVIWIKAQRNRLLWFVFGIMLAALSAASYGLHTQASLLIGAFTSSWIIGTLLAELLPDKHELRQLVQALQGKKEPIHSSRALFQIVLAIVAISWLLGFATTIRSERIFMRESLMSQRQALYNSARRVVADAICASKSPLVGRLLGSPLELDRLTIAALQLGPGWGAWDTNIHRPPPGWSYLESISGKRYSPGPPDRPLLLVIEPSGYAYDPRFAELVLAGLGDDFKIPNHISQSIERWRQSQEAQRQVQADPGFDPFVLYAGESFTYESIMLASLNIPGWNPGDVNTFVAQSKNIIRDGVFCTVNTRQQETEIAFSAPFPAQIPREPRDGDFLTLWCYASDWGDVDVLRIGIKIGENHYRVWNNEHWVLTKNFDLPADGWRFVVLPLGPQWGYDLHPKSGEDQWLTRIGSFGVALLHRHEHDPQPVDFALSSLCLRLSQPAEAESTSQTQR